MKNDKNYSAKDKFTYTEAGQVDISMPKKKDYKKSNKKPAKK